jgi:hypothetical protein
MKSFFAIMLYITLLYWSFTYICSDGKSYYGMKCRRNGFLSNIWKYDSIKWTKLSMFYIKERISACQLLSLLLIDNVIFNHFYL